ncbi:MAG: DNA (cytosine-5-)-methyltransferase [Verrucomicrobia bacterium]|jgi:DNA (cytosine-5)-methyltransferase 1|nr:DNA (cytosine-5-)-methyltransferase [Verrucomicrobiota bacterium]
MLAIEMCAGGGGQALGLEQAGFDSAVALEIDKHACATLRLNRPNWNVLEHDMSKFDGTAYKNVDLFAAGVPCPPFSVAGKQLGDADERDLFPEAIRIIREVGPKTFMLENVAGFATEKFRFYRQRIVDDLTDLGYSVDAKLLNASLYGVPQLRPRYVIVGLKEEFAPHFYWPASSPCKKTVGSTLFDLLSENGWSGVNKLVEKANHIAPTLVGGSKKHGGPDLGPTRAKRQWAVLGIDGKGIANAAPPSDAPDDFMPRLTIRMVARLQGFPDDWSFAGGKTAAYRQIGNAFPPPVAKAVARQLRIALEKKNTGYPIVRDETGQLSFMEAKA